MRQRSLVILVTLSLLLIIGFGCHIRLLTYVHFSSHSEVPLFFGTDAYRFYRQARIISEHWRLPARDMARWAPAGRDLSTSANLWSYVMAYSHILLSVFSDRLTLYRVALLSPVVCYILIALVLFFLVRDVTHNTATGLVTVFLYSVFPCGIHRASAGFSDRDAWCLLLILTSYWLFALSRKYHNSYKPYVFSFLSGTVMAILALSWEAAGLFSGLLFCVLLIELVGKSSFHRLRDGALLRNSLFTFPIIASAFLTNVYSGKANHSTPVEILLWGPVFMLALFWMLSFAVSRLRFDADSGIAKFALLGISILLSICACSLLWLPGDKFLWHKFIANFSSSLGQSRLMQQVGELEDYHYSKFLLSWKLSIIPFGIGFILMFYKAFRDCIREYWIVMACALFYVLEIVKSNIPESISGVFTGILFAAILIWMFWVTSRGATPDHSALLIALCCFALLTICVGAERYEFFLVPFAACAMAVAVIALPDWLGVEQRWFIFLIPIMLIVVQMVILIDHVVLFLMAFGVLALACAVILSLKRCQKRLLISLLGILLLSVIIQSPILGANGGTTQVMRQAATYNPISEYDWLPLKEIGNALPHSAVVLASWDMGSRINVLARKATVIDEDHYIPYWIFLAYRYAFCAESEEEALEFLKTRKVTHLLFRPYDMVSFPGYGHLGSDETFDRASGPMAYGRYQIRGKWIAISVSTQIGDVWVKADYSEKQLTLRDIWYHIDNPITNLNERRRFKRIYINNEETTLTDTDAKGSNFEEVPFFFLIFTNGNVLHFFVVHEKAYNQLFTRLYIRNLESKHFRKVYEILTKEDVRASAFQVWQVTYPDDLFISDDLRREYTPIDFLDDKLFEAWYFGTEVP